VQHREQQQRSSARAPCGHACARPMHRAYRSIHRGENWELRGHRGELREKNVKKRGDRSARMRNARAQWAGVLRITCNPAGARTPTRTRHPATVASADTIERIFLRTFQAWRNACIGQANAKSDAKQIHRESKPSASLRWPAARSQHQLRARAAVLRLSSAFVHIRPRHRAQVGALFLSCSIVFN
jgi:hypothetical protein